MKLILVILLIGSWTFCLVNGLTSEEAADLQESCCAHGERLALGNQACSAAGAPDDVEEENLSVCLDSVRACCAKINKKKEECDLGAKSAPNKKCFQPKTDTGKMCCEECALGRWTGGTEGAEACGEGADEYMSTQSALRKNIFRKCCLEKAHEPTTTSTTTTTTTTTPRPTTTTPTTTTTRESCRKSNPCDQLCTDATGVIVCQCKTGYRLMGDGKTCKDVNECAETLDELCYEPGTVCHNTPGSFRCVPLKPLKPLKRDLSHSCPLGFTRNFHNQACDDINECQLPRPPCPKYLCENTIGAYKCAGKLGAPADDSPRPDAPKSTLCPPGFRDGAGGDCDDIDECTEQLDDCQRLSQYCINSRGSFFCQDHVSRRCAPGFVANPRTGVCGDIDECAGGEACPSGQVCVNFPGAYDCKSKISMLPKLGTTTCQEGTRPRPGGSGCEDIDECREGSHLCDEFQQCVNTLGGHECRCKNGFELDPRSDACVDIDECSQNIHTCSAEQRCVNVLGSFSCSRTPAGPPARTPSSPARTTARAPAASSTTLPPEDYEYYYSDEDNSTIDNDVPYAKPPSQPVYTNRPPTTTARPSSRKPTTTRTTTSTTTSRPARPYIPPRPTLPPRPTPPAMNTNRPLHTASFLPTDSPNPLLIESERAPDGSYSLNTSSVPKDRWVNVVGSDRSPDSGGVDPNKHCIGGTVMDARGECVDIDECSTGRFICGPGEVCRNSERGYSCECAGGLRRDDRGLCIGPTTTTSTTTTARPTTSRTTTRRPITSRPTTSRTTTARSTTTEMTTTEVHEPRRGRPRLRPTTPPHLCEMGYQFDYRTGRCVDVDECATGAAACAARERCVNTPGGYRCECANCRDAPAPSARPSSITVGSQYGQRGPRYKRPQYSRLPDSQAILINCPWGYKLTEDRQCADVDECATGTSECAPEQTCKNFYGGFSCQCPAGHRLNGEKRCEDIDECELGNPCASNAACLNTAGSFECVCAAGFARAGGGACADVDECLARPCAADQTCVNSWGGYSCACARGYRALDNGTCEDIDECAEARLLGRRMCLGECANSAGGYQCRCPRGYRLAADERSCIDIDECENGEAPCAGSKDGHVCQNTRGGFHCHKIDCPPGYRLKSQHECERIDQQCSISDWDCLSRPSRYTYHFITFAANVALPAGSVDLLTVQGPAWADAMVGFELQMTRVHARSVRPAGLECFHLQPTGSRCVISLVCSLAGPQVAELELTMSVYQRGLLVGKVIIRPIIIVSEYEY